MRIDVDGVHRVEERAHLLGTETLAHAHRAVAGERRQDGVGGVVSRHAGPVLDQLAGDRSEQRADVMAAQQPRHRPQKERAIAERFALESGRRERVLVLRERSHLHRRQRNRFGHQQRVARHRTVGVLGAQALEADALVRRVLVDQHDALVALAQQVAVQDLADEAQAGEPLGRGMPERRLLRRRGRRRRRWLHRHEAQRAR